MCARGNFYLFHNEKQPYLFHNPSHSLPNMLSLLRCIGGARMRRTASVWTVAAIGACGGVLVPAIRGDSGVKHV